MSDFVLGLRQKLTPPVENLAVRGIAPGSQPLVLWKDRQLAANRRRYAFSALQVQNDSKPQGESPPDAINRALTVPVDKSARAPYGAAFDRFCQTFPDAFYVSERVWFFSKRTRRAAGGF